jgi:hypothetical protein
MEKSEIFPVSFRLVQLKERQLLRWSYRIDQKVDHFRIYSISASRGSRCLAEVSGSVYEYEIPNTLEWNGATLAMTATHGENESRLSNVTVVCGASCLAVNGETPPWFLTLTPLEQQELAKQSYYQDWLEYTANRCSDFGRLFKDNSKYTLAWRTHSDRYLLCHGDEEGRPTEEVFVTGLTAPEPLTPAEPTGEALQSNPGSMLLRGGTHQGALESFSYSFFLATFFSRRDHESYHGMENCVYVIDALGGVDVDRSISPELLRSGEAEVAFPGGVNTRHIVGAFTLNNQLQPIRYEANPNYRKIHSVPEGYVDVMVFPAVGVSEVRFNPANIDHSLPNTVRVTRGTAVTISLVNAEGHSVPGAWRINNGRVKSTPYIDSDYYTSVTPQASSCIVYTDIDKAMAGDVIVVDAYSLDPSIFGLGEPETLLPTTIKTEDMHLWPHPGPVILSVTSSAPRKYECHWQLPDNATHLAGYRVYRIISTLTEGILHTTRTLVATVEGGRAPYTAFQDSGIPEGSHKDLSGYLVTGYVSAYAETGDSLLKLPKKT